ncbi:MAG: hypothetical protein GX417_00970 [Clostridiales bacterium]|nr:hypothetical protein [Clostridiales bacterium]
MDLFPPALKEYSSEEIGDFGNILSDDGYEVCYRGECVSRIDRSPAGSDSRGADEKAQA